MLNREGILYPAGHIYKQTILKLHLRTFVYLCAQMDFLKPGLNFWSEIA